MSALQIYNKLLSGGITLLTADITLTLHSIPLDPTVRMRVESKDGGLSNIFVGFVTVILLLLPPIDHEDSIEDRDVYPEIRKCSFGHAAVVSFVQEKSPCNTSTSQVIK